MRVLISGGMHTNNIIKGIEKKFVSTGVEFLVVPFIEDIESIYARGDYFDRAIIIEQSWTADNQDTDEMSWRRKINQFATNCGARLTNGMSFVFLAQTTEQGAIAYEEIFEIQDYSAVVVKAPRYKTSFFTSLINCDLGDFPPEILYTIESDPGYSPETDYDPGYGTDTGDYGTGDYIQEPQIPSGDIPDWDGTGLDPDYGGEYNPGFTEGPGFVEDPNYGGDYNPGFETYPDLDSNDPYANESGWGADDNDTTNQDNIGENDMFKIGKDRRANYQGQDIAEEYPGEEFSIPQNEPEQVSDIPYAGDSYRREPANDPYGNDPYGNDPYGNDPYGNDPYGNDPYGNNQSGNDQSGNDPYGNDPYGNNQSGNDPYGNGNYSGDPYGNNTGDNNYGYGGDPYNQDTGYGNGADVNSDYGNNREVDRVNMSDSQIKAALQAFASRGNSIVVTGCGGCGTSTVAFNLANTLCNLGYSVLLVDMDTMGRTQSYISKDNYDSMDADGANLIAAVNSSTGMNAHMAIVRQGFHLLSMGIGGDLAEPDKLIHKQKLMRFTSAAKNGHNFVIYDIPFKYATDFFSEVIHMCDNIVLTVDASNWGVTKTMINMCNIQSDEIQDAMFNRAQLLFNRYKGNNKFFGKKVRNIRNVPKEMDHKVSELIGEEPEFYFKDMHIAGVINEDPEFETGWYSRKHFSDVKKGQQIFIDLIKSIVLNA